MRATISFYEVDTDVESFQYLVAEGTETASALLAGDAVVGCGRPVSDGWHPPDVHSHKPLLPEGDFCCVLGLGGASFAIRPEALEHGHLEVFLAAAGELLPLPYADREFRLLNITECFDALDHSATAWDYPLRDEELLAEIAADEPERVITAEEIEASRRVVEPRFRLDRLGGQLFKVPETAVTRMYYWERDVDGDDERFRVYCEREGLTGLVFRELYATDCPW